MIIIGVALFLVFAGLGLLHFYWLTGGLWPGKDIPTLNGYVVGTTRNRAPDQYLTLAVVGAFASAAGIVLARHGLITLPEASDPIFLRTFRAIAYSGMIFVFAGRGLAPYITPAFNYARGTPFYQLNRRYYAPLCLLIAALLIADFPWPEP